MTEKNQGQQVFIWLCTTSDNNISAAEMLLSPAERARAEQLKNLSRRHQFTCSRAMIKRALSHLFPEHPADHWHISLDGPPTIKGFESRIAISLSHSGDLCACAILLANPDQENRIGIDCQQAKPYLSWQKIAETFFSPHENNWLQSLNENKKIRSFYRLWTQKEAQIKAAGLEFFSGLNRLKQSDDEWRTLSFEYKNVPVSVALPTSVTEALSIRALSIRELTVREIVDFSPLTFREIEEMG